LGRETTQNTNNMREKEKKKKEKLQVNGGKLERIKKQTIKGVGRENRATKDEGE